MKNYYVPIKSTSLAHYFSKACIYPVKYFNNRIEDIQNKFDDFILLSNKKWIKNTDCSLGIELTKEEISKIHRISESFSLLNFPLPFSRICNIYFNSEEQKDTTVWNINSGAAFIPPNILAVQQKNKKDIADENELNNITANLESIELKEKIKRYDKILGGFALMQLGGENYMNYSPNYFDTLSYFNLLIKEEIKNIKNTINDMFFGIFSEEPNGWSKIIPYIGENLTVDNIKSIAADEGVKLKEKFGLIEIDSINQKSYLFSLAIFATYGKGKRKSVDDLISLLLSDNFSTERKEGIAFLFGMHNGYSNFRNLYKIRGYEKAVKLKLDSQLDYYTIESIYQYVFNNRTNNARFNYIDSWCPRQTVQSIEGYKTHKVLDKLVITKKKYPISSFEYSQEFLEENPIKTVYTKLTELIFGWLPSRIKTKEFVSQIREYFEDELKQDFIQFLMTFAKNIDSDNQDEFEKRQSEIIKKFENEKEKLNKQKNLLEIENKNLQDRISKYENKLVSSKEEENITFVHEPQYEYEDDRLTDLSKMNLKELQSLAKERGIKSFSRFKKNDLIIRLNKDKNNGEKGKYDEEKDLFAS